MKFKVEVKESHIEMRTGFAIIEADSEQQIRNNHIETCARVQENDFSQSQHLDYQYEIESIEVMQE